MGASVEENLEEITIRTAIILRHNALEYSVDEAEKRLFMCASAGLDRLLDLLLEIVDFLHEKL